MNLEEAKQLLNRYNSGQCTEEEKSLIERSFFSYNEQEIEISQSKIEKLGQEIFLNLNSEIKKKSNLKLWATFSGAAATIAIALWILYPKNSIEESFKLADQIIPAGNQATVTLSNGEQISLSPSKNTLIVNSSQLSYADGLKIKAGKLSAHQTIATPNGGEYKIVLSDGTKVWLNAATVLQYPTSFRERTERRVKLVSGEAYFEVTKNKAHPFIVSTANQNVTVLGTSFNIKAYNQSIKTTLLEGSVRLNLFNPNNQHNKAIQLKPGEQSLNEEKRLTKKVVDADLVTAWKNGKIKFMDADLKSILTEAERWYNIEVRYDGKVPDIRLTGGISRKSSLATLLKLLQMSGVNFSLKKNLHKNTLTIESNN